MSDITYQQYVADFLNQPIPTAINTPTTVYPSGPYAGYPVGTIAVAGLSGANLTPNLPTILIPIFGSILVTILVGAFPNLFAPVVIGLIGIILLWLTKPTK